HPGSDIAKLALPTIDDLTNETLLVREPGSGTRAIFAQYCLEQGVRFDRMQQLGSIEAVKAGVLAGLGTAVLPADACQNELALGKLKTLSIRGFPLRRSWCALYPKGKQLTPVAERFLNHLLGSG
ncbi:MAG TPA: LysR substrate-binding domain-containing protein, partial [Pseudomonadales bacterium]|nr:LysR substrate-binding domain-containing protein [Pseudomonadales bacterium]